MPFIYLQARIQKRPIHINILIRLSGLVMLMHLCENKHMYRISFKLFLS